MAAIRSRAQLPVGSAQWINDENDQAAQFCAQETEDFTFSARNEVEWLNEHMMDIFSKNHNDITECFKTPGKLRGKTPRTARKRNPLETREPLTDIFTTNAPSNKSQPKASPFKHAATFQVAEDPIAPAASERKAPKSNTDSGYHGLPEDDMDVDEMPNVPQSSAETNGTIEVLPELPPHEQPPTINHSEERSTTDRSFHSAREEVTEPVAQEKSLGEAPTRTNVEKALGATEKLPEMSGPLLDQNSMEDQTDIDTMEKDLDEDLVVDASRSPSQGSSPARPLARKSSLTFAPLPPREFTTKKSIGARASQTGHLEQSKGNKNRGSIFEQLTAGRSLGGLQQAESSHQKELGDRFDIGVEKPEVATEDSDVDSKITKLHNKSSTQRLHDRINMLGKSQPARPTKSIPAVAAMAGPNHPEQPKQDPQPALLQHMAELASQAAVAKTDEEDDDDWIQPPPSQTKTLNRPQLPKSISVDVMEDITGKKTIGGGDFSQSRDNEAFIQQLSTLPQPNVREDQRDGSPLNRTISALESPRSASAVAHVLPRTSNEADPPMTPADDGSSRRYVDGPLSASKSKLQSIMKTARGLFSSSAGVSAQAKMETLSPSMRIHEEIQGPSINATLKHKGAKNRALSPVPNRVGRQTRSSTEKEEKRKKLDAQEHEQDVEKTTAKMTSHENGHVVEVAQIHVKPIRQSPRKIQPQEASTVQSHVANEEALAHVVDPPTTQAQHQAPQLQRSKEVRRVQKPAKEAAPKTKPPPVAIRVGTLSQGMRMNSALSTNLQDSLGPPQPRQPVVAKKASNPSLHQSASNSSLKSSVAALTKPKALIAAERKKEQDEKEAQRKLDQKREIERKRAAQQEEARKQEQLQRQEVEKQRERERSAAAEDPKLLAKKQAIEKRRIEMKKDQQRAPPPRSIVEIVQNANQAQTAPTSRPELGGPRPLSRLHNVPDNGRITANQPLQNPARPPIKRVFDPDADDEPVRHTRMPGGSTYHQNEGKRRKTENEDFDEPRIRPTMAPPIRQSGIRPGGPKPSIFNNSYAAAPQPAPHNHHPTSFVKSATINQAYQQHTHQNPSSRPANHPDIAKYQNGRIPFAENPNPSQPHKTPLHSRLNAQAAKSSPQYVNGENIHLDDIPTESEDEDSDDDPASKPKPANLPDWAQSPQLRQLLMSQDENMDADAVFGPVQSPRMEEMFRERHHRFRSRTSSANWAGADRLTEEEIRRDVEARQRLRREGGWTFGL